MSRHAISLSELDPLVVAPWVSGELTESGVEAAIEYRELIIDHLKSEVEKLHAILRRLTHEAPVG